MLKNLIGPNVYFSYGIAKGSKVSRQKLAEDILENVYDGVREIHKRTQKDYLSRKELLYLANDTLPEKNKQIGIRFVPLSTQQANAGGADLRIDENDRIIGHFIELVFERGKFPIYELPTFLHEMLHVLDKMLNPKIIKRLVNTSNKLAKSDALANVDRLYDKLYPKSYEKFSNEIEKQAIIAKHEKTIKKFLSKKSPEIKIDVLQNLRYQLLLELHAYNVENSYIERMCKPNNVDPSEIMTNVDKFLFREKIDMIESLLKEILRDERAKLAKQNVCTI